MSTLLDQQTEVHVQLGNGAPAFLPTALGQHYIDIANRRVYQSVGINSVEDWALPLATMKDIQELDLVGDKADVGLGNVEDYGVASQSEAELGQANDRYMTPLRVTQLLNALFMPVLDTFMARRDNPHQVTAEQVGALTSEATQLLLDEKLAEGDLAGLLQAFWAEKVGSAPETLDTIQEISAALQNNPDVITALQQLVNDNAAAIGALETRVDGIDTTIAQVQTDLSAEVTARTTADQALDAKINEVDSRLDDSKVDVGGDISTNTVTQGEGEEAQQVALSTLIAQLQAGISEAGDASDLEALQTALNDFIAAKATSAEAIAGTDDAKYITALGLKAAVDAAINGVVDGAPVALNTLKELADALANQEDAVAALVSVIDTKLNQTQVQAEIASVVNPIDVRLTSVEDAIGTGSDFLQEGISDLGTNPVYLASDVPTVIGGDDFYYTYFEPGLDVRARRVVDGGYIIEYNKANDDVDWVVVDNTTMAGVEEYVAGVYATESLPDTTVYYFNVDIEEPEPDTLASMIDGLRYNVQVVLEDRLQDKVNVGAAIGTNTVTFPDAESLEPTQQALDDVLEYLRLAVKDVQGAAATDLADLQTAFNNFVAAKATTAEVIAGTDDAKYTTSLSVKGAIDAAIADLVGAAPEALNTINELAEALNNDPDVINALMSSIGTNATAIEALETAVGVFEAKVMDYFDVDGNANNANLFAGKTLNEVLDMARDGVDMSNVVLKTDDFGPYTVALDSDTTTQEVPILVETVDTAAAMVHIVRVGEIVTVEISDGEGNYATVTEAEMGPDRVLIQEAIDARVGDFDQYFALGSTNQEVTTAARTLKALFEALELADKATHDRITSEVAAVYTHVDSVEQNAQQALANWTESIQQNLNRIDTFAGETRQMAFDNQQALAGKVGVGSNVDTNVVTVGEAEVALSQVIADIKAEIATKGSASEESLALLEQKVDDFIAAKATGEEAIAGTDNVKYITALALKAAIAELESRAVLDGEHVSTNLVTFDHQDLVLEKQIQDFDTELLTREVGQELWSVVRNAGVDTFSMSTDGVTFNPLPPLEMFPEAQRPVYEALFTELSAWVDDEEAADGTVFYAVTENRTVLGPVSKVDVLLKDVLSVLETKVAQLFKDVSSNHQNSMASDNQIREDLGNLQGKVYDLNRGVVETLAGAPEMAVKFDFSAAWTQGALHQIEALEFLGGDDSVIGTVALDQVKLHSGIMGYENGVINLSGLGYFQPRQTVLNIGDIPAGAVKLRVVGTGLENGVGVLEVGSIGAKGVVYGSLAIVENLDVANSLVVPFAVPKLSDINDLKDQAADVVDRVADLETDKLDVTAQAVDSAKLEGKSIADLTASSADGVAGVATDKFMTPAASKDAFDARWAEKVGAAPETLDTIEEIAAALRNNPDSLAALETVAKQYTDAEVLAAIAQISGENMEAGTTLASLYAQVVALQNTKLDKTATAVNSDKLGGKSLMEVIDSAIQPGRLFYPVVHVNGSLAEDNYVMPTPADVWAQVKTNAVMEQVDTIYAVGVKRLLPGNLLALTNQEGMTLRGAVSEAQEGPGYVIMRAGIEDTEWTVITDPLLGCVARLSKHCVVVGDNTERFVPGQTLFYNGFEALSENVYYDWTLMADKEWEVTTFTGTDLMIDSARYHRSEIRIQSTGPVTVTFDVPTDLPYEMEVRFVNQTGVEVTFAGSNVVSVPRMQQYTLTKVNGVVRAVRYTNTSVALAGDMDEAFFVNPNYSAPQI